MENDLRRIPFQNELFLLILIQSKLNLHKASYIESKLHLHKSYDILSFEPYTLHFHVDSADITHSPYSRIYFASMDVSVHHPPPQKVKRTTYECIRVHGFQLIHIHNAPHLLQNQPHHSLLQTPLTRLRFGSADFPGLVNGSDKENEKLTFSFLMHMRGDTFQAIMFVLVSHSLCAHVLAHACTHLCHTTPCWEKCRPTMLNVENGAWTLSEPNN